MKKTRMTIMLMAAMTMMTTACSSEQYVYHRRPLQRSLPAIPQRQFSREIAHSDFRTFRTKPLQYVVDTFQTEALRQLYRRHVDLLQTEGAVTACTKEMGVFFLVIVIVITVVMADIVFQRSTAIVNGMDESVKEEKGKRTRNSTFIYGWQQLFQPWQRQHLIATVELLQNEQARGGGLDVVMLQVVNE